MSTIKLNDGKSIPALGWGYVLVRSVCKRT